MNDQYDKATLVNQIFLGQRTGGTLPAKVPSDHGTFFASCLPLPNSEQVLFHPLTHYEILIQSNVARVVFLQIYCSFFTPKLKIFFSASPKHFEEVPCSVYPFLRPDLPYDRRRG